MLLRLLSFKFSVSLVFSLILSEDSGFLLISNFSKKFILFSNCNLTLLSDVTFCSNSLFVLCAFCMF